MEPKPTSSLAYEYRFIGMMPRRIVVEGAGNRSAGRNGTGGEHGKQPKRQPRITLRTWRSSLTGGEGMESETLLTRFMEATLTEKLHRETVDHLPWMNVPSPLGDALIH